MTFWDYLNIVASVLFSAVSGGAIVLGLSSWLGKVWANRILEREKAAFASQLEQQKATYAGELEKLKSDYRHEVDRQLQTLRDEQERGQFVHRLQFETEFRSYMKFWPRAHAVSLRARQLRPVVEWGTSKIPDEERRKNLGDAFEAYREAFELRKPFFSPDVYDAAERLDGAIFKEFWEWNRGYDMSRHGEYWDAAAANQKRIVDFTDAICDAIRARVGLIAPAIGQTRLEVEDAASDNTTGG